MAHLQQLLPLNEPDNFPIIAEELLLRTQIVVNGHVLRILEIEFYLCSDTHPDIFCHQFADQKTNLQWYFHRASEKLHSYKGGSYKGLDITCGSANSYGGILIRSIQNETSTQIIQGPCNCVNHILDLCKTASVKDLVVDKLGNDLSVSNSILRLEPRLDPNGSSIFKSPRVGLTLKTTDPVQLVIRKEYISKLYRYLIKPHLIAKYKKLTCLIAIDSQPNDIIGVMRSFNLDGKKLEAMEAQIYDLKSKTLDYKKYVGQNLTDSDRIELYFCKA